MPQVPNFQIQPVNGPELMRVPTEAPISAFGGGEDVDRASDANNQLAQSISDVAQKHADMANQVATTDLDTKLASLQTKLQLQASTMLGKNAMAAPAITQNDWTNGVQQILQAAGPNQAVARAAEASAMARGSVLNDDVGRHVSEQLVDYENNQVTGAITTSQQLATLNASNPQRVSQELQHQQGLATQWAARHGISTDDPQYQQFLTSTKSTTYTNVISQLLQNGKYSAAANYFNQAKDESALTDEDLKYLSGQMKDAHAANAAIQVTDKLKTPTFQYPDGTPNVQKGLDLIQKDPTLSDEQKLSATDKIISFGREMVRTNAEQGEALRKSLADQATKIQQSSNGTLAQALALVPTNTPRMADGSINLAEETANTKMVEDIFAPQKTTTDPTVFVGLHDGIVDGKVTPADITSAFNAGQISSKDFQTLHSFAVTNSGIDNNDEMNMAYGQVDKMAATKLGNSDEAAQFGAYVRSATNGKNPSDILKTGTDELKNIGSPNLYNFQVDSAHDSRVTEDLGPWNKAIGSDQVRALAQAVMVGGEKNWSLIDIKDILQQVAHVPPDVDDSHFMDLAKKGSSLNNAILSATRNGYPATPKMLDWILTQDKDGVWNKP